MIDELLKHRSTIIQLIVKQLMAFLGTKLPFLSFAPVAWVIAKILGVYLDKLLIVSIKEIESNLAERDRVALAENIEKLLKQYEDEPDDTQREIIETQIINDARNLIKFNRLRSVTAER